jgi:hypothetical protein
MHATRRESLWVALEQLGIGSLSVLDHRRIRVQQDVDSCNVTLSGGSRLLGCSAPDGIVTGDANAPNTSKPMKDFSTCLIVVSFLVIEPDLLYPKVGANRRTAPRQTRTTPEEKLVRKGNIKHCQKC